MRLAGCWYGRDKEGEIRIVKIGTFDEDGHPQGWQIDTMWDRNAEIALNCLPNGDVEVGGVLILEWTNERRKRMGKQPKGGG